MNNKDWPYKRVQLYEQEVISYEFLKEESVKIKLRTSIEVLAELIGATFSPYDLPTATPIETVRAVAALEAAQEALAAYNYEAAWDAYVYAKDHLQSVLF